MGPKYEDSLVGKTFEKCRIIGKIGTGGMGSVWLAEHFGLGRKVAVKILPTDMGRDPEYVARFMREATTAGRMEHPNIVQIHDVGYAEGRHFIVMQYVDGESLSTVVDNLGAMDPKDAARIASGMLRGLQHAHEEGVVHRDVKPDNVLIAKGDEPKLLDFGLAIETETALQITKDGMVVGTPYYLAPEQARGQKATPLSDIYAAGVTLYYLLTGKRPFVGATALAVLNKHIHEAPVPPSKLRPVIPRPLNDIVLKMMAKKPGDRYQTAGACADDLDSFLKGKEIQVRVPLRLPPFLAALSRTQQIFVAAGAGSAVLLLIILIIVALSGGGKTTTSNATKGPGPTIVEADESPKLGDCQDLERKCLKDKDYAAYPAVLEKYDATLRLLSVQKWIDKTKESRKAFVAGAAKTAADEIARMLKDPDPYARLRLLLAFPEGLKIVGDAEEPLEKARQQAVEGANRQYVEDETKLADDLAEHRFKEAGDRIDRMLTIASGERKGRLQKIKGGLKTLQADFEDEVLRKLDAEYQVVHEAFEAALIKRDIVDAYGRVASFMRGVTDETARARLRIGGVNYDALLSIVPDSQLTDSRLGQVRASLISPFTRATKTLPYQVLADLQDALDVVWLLREAYTALREGQDNFRMETFSGATGRISLSGVGFQFVAKGSGTKPFTFGQLNPLDLIMIAGAAQKQDLGEIRKLNDALCRAAGVVWLYSAHPARWAQAMDWFRQAEKIGVQGLAFRLDGLQERGFKEVFAAFKKVNELVDRKSFAEARSLLATLENAWAQDAGLKQEIGRATAVVLVAEMKQQSVRADHPGVKASARLLRSKYPSLYSPELVDPPYQFALRSTGRWETVGNLLNEDWSWDGKGAGTPCPAGDDTKTTRGFRLAGGQAIFLAPVRSRGATGARVNVCINDTFKPCAAGFRFDRSEKDGRHRRLVIRENGELALIESDGGAERVVQAVPLGRKIVAGDWLTLSYIAEGGDLACWVNDRPMLLVSAPVPTDREVGIWASASANFRGLELRR